jgi:hypothetical protein
MANEPERFRALLTCTVCGNVVLAGPWTTGDRALAAYHLGRAPANASNAVREHLARAGHALRVTFETC